VVGSGITLQPATSAIHIDGNLDEWDPSEAVFLTTGNPSAAGDGKGAFDDNHAKLAMRYDKDALYVGIWWHDPSPLGKALSPATLPASDGLVLHLPIAGVIRHLALWQDTQTGKAQAMMAKGDTTLQQGSAVTQIMQGFLKTSDRTYTQEIQIPWDVLGGHFAENDRLRIGIELCFGGLDMTAGYRAWLNEMSSHASSGNRWGGNICWGFVDGIRDESVVDPRMDPANGALVELQPAGAIAPNNPPVMFMGNERTRTMRMIAIPAENIKIDGKIEENEWKAATATRIASEPTLLPEHYETDVYWAYDAKGLYMALRWYTGGEHLNINDPAVLNRGYDGGDDLQVRLLTDRVTHVDTWYCDSAKRAAMKLEYGAKFNEGSVPDALPQGAQMAIAPLPDRGYTQEIFLPWSLITRKANALAEGDSFRVILDLFYSGLEKNRLPFIVNAAVAASSGIVTIPFTTPRDGFYTVTIDNDHGVAIRRLLTHKKLLKGQAVTQWDGLDDDGKPVPSGTYHFRGLHHTGIGLDYLTTTLNPGNPPWQTYDGTGEWGGDHSPPQAVATDDWGVYLGWPAAEDGNGIIGCDINGQKKWGFFQTPQPTSAGTAVLASDGNYLFFGSDIMVSHARSLRKNEPMVTFQTILTCLDRKTGRRRGFSLDKPFTVIDAFDTTKVSVRRWFELWPQKDFTLDSCGIVDQYYFSQHCTTANLTGMVAGRGKLYVSLRIEQKIVVFDSNTLQEIARWDVPKPAGLVLMPDGTLMAISNNRIVNIMPKDGSMQPIVTDSLDAPVDIALDAEGNIYVSQWGQAQCIAVFNPDGSKLRTIGKQGGRNWVGSYDPNGMLMPRGIAIDPQGKLWVCEDDNHPRRISVWDAKTGQFMREFVGGTTYGAAQGGILDPTDPSRLVSLGNVYQIDLSKEGYRPLTTMYRQTSADQIFSLNKGWCQNAQFITAQGRRYFRFGSGGIFLLGQMQPDGTWLPQVAIGGVYPASTNSMLNPEEKRIWRMDYYPDFMRKHGGENFIWTDQNGDGGVQENEFQWAKVDKQFPLLGISWGVGSINDNMDIVTGSEHGNAIFRFKRQGWTASNVPVYDLSKRERISQPTGRICAVTTDHRGNVLTAQRGEWEKPNFKPYYTSYGKDSSVIWKYPASKDVRPLSNIDGEGFLGPIDAGPNVGQIWSLTQWHGGQMPIMTTDGLFIGKVLRDPSADNKPGPDVYRGETVQCMTKLDDGRIIISHGKNAHHLFQLTGMDTVVRFGGTFSINDEQAQLAKDKLNEHTRTNKAIAPILMKSLKNELKIDGNFDDWNTIPSSDIGDSDVIPHAQVKLACDDKWIYMAFDVTKKGSFINQGEDINQLFLSGDAVDLQFSLDATADAKRREPVVGDCRLLLSEHQGKPVAVLYEALVPLVKKPVAFRSPNRAVVFDQVKQLDQAQIVIINTDSGYRLEAAIPSKELFGNAIWPGRIFQGDAGIIVADQTGRRVARIYRFNKNTTIINDIPTEAALGLANWGEIEVEQPGK
jgi:hypothetical protein